MSKFWNKMAILREAKKYNKNLNKKGEENEEDEENSLYISQDKPAFFVNKDYYNVKTSSRDKYSETEIAELSDFYNKNFRVGKSNNTNIVSEEELYKYLSLSSEMLTIRKDSKLLGCMISIYIPTHVNIQYKQSQVCQCEKFDEMCSDNSTVFGCASFLILDESYKGKGLGMALIQESLQSFYEQGGLGAYFVNTVSRCDNSIKFQTWYFPFSFSKLNRCKYNYPKDYTQYFIQKLEDIKKENLEIRKVKEEIRNVKAENVRAAYDFYILQGKDKKFFFIPSFEYWHKWISCFPTYIVLKNNAIIGLFCFRDSAIKYYNKNEIKVGLTLLCIGEQPYTLKCTLLKASELYDIINFYELADLNKALLSSILAQKGQIRYINFYNTRLNLQASEFYAPIF